MTTSKQRYKRPYISVEEARKILGEVAAGMTDEEIRDVIVTLDLIAKEALGLYNKHTL